MAHDELAAVLGGFEGFELVHVTREPGAEPPRLVLELRPQAGFAGRGVGDVDPLPPRASAVSALRTDRGSRALA
jgi:hypothetical protein